MPTSSAGKTHPALQPGHVQFSNVKNTKTQAIDIAVNIKTTLSVLDSKITSLKITLTKKTTTATKMGREKSS